MSKEVQNIDVEDHAECIKKCKNLELKLDLLLNQKENTTNTINDSTEQQPQAPKGHHDDDVTINETSATHTHVVDDNNRSLDDIKELEKFRLGVWLAKTFVLMMAAIVLGLIILFITATYLTKTLPDLSILESIFNHLKDVVVIIANTEK